MLTLQELVACDPNDFGCQGGYLDKAWEYMSKVRISFFHCFVIRPVMLCCYRLSSLHPTLTPQHGLPTETCEPYTAGGGSEGPCPDSCVDGSDKVRFVQFCFVI